jgi:NADP-dependent 3-hydroxy acid dehydrogenase YdfG
MVDEPSAERIVIVTGVSRRTGIGFAVARRLLDDGEGSAPLFFPVRRQGGWKR